MSDLHHAHETSNPATSSAGTDILRDPVCGMEIDPGEVAEQVTHAGVAHSFCSSGCARKFRDDPERYLDAEGPPNVPAPREPAPAPPAATGRWTCPMHPEVVEDGPGSCPICGMALEPVAPSLDEGENQELSDMTRRFRVSAILSAPLLVSSMGAMMP